MNLTVKQVQKAVTKALATYNNDQTWAQGVLAVEYEEAGGYMGSDSAYKNINRREFAERLLAALEEEL